jgi:hypothetical protein
MLTLSARTLHAIKFLQHFNKSVIKERKKGNLSTSAVNTMTGSTGQNKISVFGHEIFVLVQEKTVFV